MMSKRLFTLALSVLMVSLAAARMVSSRLWHVRTSCSSGPVQGWPCSRSVGEARVPCIRAKGRYQLPIGQPW